MTMGFLLQEKTLLCPREMARIFIILWRSATRWSSPESCFQDYMYGGTCTCTYTQNFWRSINELNIFENHREYITKTNIMKMNVGLVEFSTRIRRILALICTRTHCLSQRSDASTRDLFDASWLEDHRLRCPWRRRILPRPACKDWTDPLKQNKKITVYMYMYVVHMN